MTQHTPTPWHYNEKFNGIYDGPDVRGAMVQIANIVHTPDYKANAAFIVRACNAHDALVDRLIECQEFIIGYHAAEENDMRRRILGEIIIKNNQALKLARGEG